MTDDSSIGHGCPSEAARRPDEFGLRRAITEILRAFRLERIDVIPTKALALRSGHLLPVHDYSYVLLWIALFLLP